MSSGKTAQDQTWKSREQAEEANYVRQKEREQLEALNSKLDQKDTSKAKTEVKTIDRDFEGGFGGQEDLEDRYATTSGEH
ncbi:hypothetical protein CPB83DRAFT_847625 [Crepidotus variabilis]|uniref:ATPase inhibitor, mitochondrial n=1 Tax=Crepidotus variabilis TaxID=179855 RepID=A0A9P6JTF4_9AGAR|nr:hypothetical protein CPB83DRAFT_847625 [Crepidotus variabilis]